LGKLNIKKESMSSLLLDSLILLFLFVILGYFADVVVYKIKFIAKALGLRLFVLGIILGIVTTLPELSVGVNATINEVASLSAGNLLGGILVILGFILGLSLWLNRRLSSIEIVKTLVPAGAVMFLPLLLGIDGSYGTIDGLLMILAYTGLLLYLYKVNRPADEAVRLTIHKREIFKSIFIALLGTAVVLVAANWIVDISVRLLTATGLSQMMIGLLVFAIGTNLPEITVVLVSWRRKTSELSLSHLVSSAFTNVLVLGILATLGTISFRVDATYYFLMLFLSLMIILFMIFSYTDKKLTKQEGIILFLVYAMFVFSNILLTL